MRAAETVAHAVAGVRAEFVRKTYLHLAGAIPAFAPVETCGPTRWASRGTVELMLSPRLVAVGSSWCPGSSTIRRVLTFLRRRGTWGWVSAPGRRRSSSSSPCASPSTTAIRRNPGVLSLPLAGVTAVALTPGMKLSFLRGAEVLGSVLALDPIVPGFFGFMFGVVSSAAMVGLAAAMVLCFSL